MPAQLTLDVATTPYRLRVNKGEDFTLRIPILDATGANVDVTGWSAVAEVVGPGTTGVLYTWSTANGLATCATTGVTLTFNSAATGAWQWADGEFELDITSPAGKRSIVAAGPFTAVQRYVTP